MLFYSLGIALFVFLFPAALSVFLFLLCAISGIYLCVRGCESDTQVICFWYSSSVQFNLAFVKQNENTDSLN